MPNIDLSERPASREELAAWYAAVLDDQAASGLSVPEYAAELGVTPATLYSWRRRLASDSESRCELHEGSSRGLIEVSMDDASPSDHDAFILHLSRDRRVEVPPGFDPGALRRLVTALEQC